MARGKQARKPQAKNASGVSQTTQQIAQPQAQRNSAPRRVTLSISGYLHDGQFMLDQTTQNWLNAAMIGQGTAPAVSAGVQQQQQRKTRASSGKRNRSQTKQAATAGVGPNYN